MTFRVKTFTPTKRQMEILFHLACKCLSMKHLKMATEETEVVKMHNLCCLKHKSTLNEMLQRLRSTWAAAAGADRLLVLFNALEICFPQCIIYFKSALCKCYELTVKYTFAFCKNKWVAGYFKDEKKRMERTRERSKIYNVFFSKTHWPQLLDPFYSITFVTYIC